MSNEFATVYVPTRLGAPALAWPSKDPLDILPVYIDATDWLALYGLTISGTPRIRTSPLLTVTLIGVVGPLITLLAAGGVDGTTGEVGVLIPLSGGKQLEVGVQQPVNSILTGPLVAPNSVLFGGVPVTFGTLPVVFGP